MADERGTRLNEGLDKWLQVTDTDKLETWDGTDKMAALKESLGINDNVAISDIVDDLNSTDVDKPLSANQGKVLQDSKEDADNTILKEDDVEDSLNSTSVTKPLSANQGKVLQDGKEDADNTILKEGDVENTLTSTSTTKPLSANQGKQLNDDKASLSEVTIVANVKGFGAIGDGVTDDSASIQAAIDDVNNKGGGVVYIPRGTYRAEEITIKDGVEIKGDGVDTTIIEAVSTTGPVQVIKTPSTTTVNIALRDFTVDGRRTDGQTGGGGLINFENTFTFSVERVKALNPFSHCFDAESCRNGYYLKCRAEAKNTYGDAPDDGFAVGGASRNVRYFSCTAIDFKDNSRQTGFECDDGPEDIYYFGCHTLRCWAGYSAHTHANRDALNNINYIGCYARESDIGFRCHARENAPINLIIYTNCHAIDCSDFSGSQQTQGGNGRGFRFGDFGGTATNIKVLNCSVQNAIIGLKNDYATTSVIGLTIEDCETDYENIPSSQQNFFNNSPEIPSFDWNPTFFGGTDAGSYSLANTVAKYVRKGNTYSCFLQTEITESSAGSGRARIGGLPNTTAFDVSIPSIVILRKNLTDINGGFFFSMLAGENEGRFLYEDTNGNGSSLTINDFDFSGNNPFVRFQFDLPIS